MRHKLIQLWAQIAQISGGPMVTRAHGSSKFDRHGNKRSRKSRGIRAR